MKIHIIKIEDHGDFIVYEANKDEFPTKIQKENMFYNDYHFVAKAPSGKFTYWRENRKSGVIDIKIEIKQRIDRHKFYELNTSYLTSFNFVISYILNYMENVPDLIVDNSPETKCKCEMSMLMTTGCQCGGK